MGKEWGFAWGETVEKLLLGFLCVVNGLGQINVWEKRRFEPVNLGVYFAVSV